MPGDPFTFLSASEGQITITYSEEQIAKYKAYYGLDKPMVVQYTSYLTSLVKGNIGYSIYYNNSVINVIGKRILWTVTIVIAAILISCLIGTVLGSLSTWYRNGVFDKVLYSLLDPSTQANVLRLLKGLQNLKGFAMLYITHDLALARKIADRVYVMYKGRIIEHGSVVDVFDSPQESYTSKLVNNSL